MEVLYTYLVTTITDEIRYAIKSAIELDLIIPQKQKSPIIYVLKYDPEEDIIFTDGKNYLDPFQLFPREDKKDDLVNLININKTFIYLKTKFYYQHFNLICKTEIKNYRVMIDILEKKGIVATTPSKGWGVDTRTFKIIIPGDEFYNEEWTVDSLGLPMTKMITRQVEILYSKYSC